MRPQVTASAALQALMRRKSPVAEPDSVTETSSGSGLAEDLLQARHVGRARGQ